MDILAPQIFIEVDVAFPNGLFEARIVQRISRTVDSHSHELPVWGANIVVLSLLWLGILRSVEVRYVYRPSLCMLLLATVWTLFHSCKRRVVCRIILLHCQIRLRIEVLSC